MVKSITRELGTVPAYTPEQLLSQSRQLLSHGHHLTAAMVARAALETVLRTVVDRFGLELSGRPTFFQWLHAIKRAGFIEKADVRELMRLSTIGCKAAHNYHISQAEAAELIDAVDQFTTTIATGSITHV